MAARPRASRRGAGGGAGCARRRRRRGRRWRRQRAVGDRHPAGVRSRSAVPIDVGHRRCADAGRWRDRGCARAASAGEHRSSGGEPLAALGAPGPQHGPAGTGGHAMPKAVPLGPLPVVRLVGALQLRAPLTRRGARLASAAGHEDELVPRAQRQVAAHRGARSPGARRAPVQRYATTPPNGNRRPFADRSPRSGTPPRTPVERMLRSPPCPAGAAGDEHRSDDRVHRRRARRGAHNTTWTPVRSGHDQPFRARLVHRVWT